MIIDVLELQNVVQKICRKCIENNGRYLETEENHFWFIDMERGLDFKDEPSALCVGSLEDDYISLGEISSESREVNILDLDRISNIFKLISYEIEKSKDKML